MQQKVKLFGYNSIYSQNNPYSNQSNLSNLIKNNPISFTIDSNNAKTD